VTPETSPKKEAFHSGFAQKGDRTAGSAIFRPRGIQASGPPPRQQPSVNGLVPNGYRAMCRALWLLAVVLLLGVGMVRSLVGNTIVIGASYSDETPEALDTVSGLGFFQWWYVTEFLSSEAHSSS
jgi:hypothetical protein